MMAARAHFLLFSGQLGSVAAVWHKICISVTLQCAKFQ